MVKNVEKKSWYKSKTKWSVLLIGAGPVLVTLGNILAGNLNFMSGMQNLAPQLGIILGVFGIRDIPFLNRTK